MALIDRANRWKERGVVDADTLPISQY